MSGRNRGGHALLKDGARLVESADDVLEELGLVRGADRPARARQAGSDDAVLAALPSGEAVDLEEIAAKSTFPIEKILTRLLELELQGRVRREAGGRFVLTDRTC
jgi:DNA processing protein